MSGTNGTKVEASAVVAITRDDELWHGRELNRHAQRATDAHAKLERVGDALEALEKSCRQKADDAMRSLEGSDMREENASTIRARAFAQIEIADELKRIASELVI